jgi:dienelactone hydrolase
MAALLLGGTALPLAAREEPAEPIEEIKAFAAGGVAGTLLLSAGAPDRRAPAVVTLHDALGPDGRASLYTDQPLGAGLAVQEIQTVQGYSLPAVLDSLGAHPSLAGQPVGLLEFGLGARQAAEWSGPVTARALLYPGCGWLTPVGGGAALLMHGAADFADEAGACADLARRLGPAGVAVGLRVLADATYAWDRPASSVGGQALPPRPGGPGRVIAEAWPELAALSATEVAWFFATSLLNPHP